MEFVSTVLYMNKYVKGPDYDLHESKYGKGPDYDFHEA